jgi:hypothetical protein
MSPPQLTHRLIGAAVAVCLGLATACSGQPPGENLTNTRPGESVSTTTTEVALIPRGLNMYDRYTEVIGHRCNPNREICWE